MTEERSGTARAAGAPEPDREFRLVRDPAGLVSALRRLEGAGEIGVDVEMNGLHAYRAHVCVVQIATESADLVIDAVLVKDLAPVAPLLGSRGVTRYVHGAAHDVKCLKADHGIALSGLFDTYVAAQLLGIERLGYGHVVADRFGAPLDKKLQTADWGKRPFTPKQIEYLRGDVRWLVPLGRQLREELKSHDLVEEAEDEFARVESLPPEPDGPPDDAWLRVRDARSLPPVGLAVLRGLFRTREALARRLDRPPFKVAGEPTLLEIARRVPRSLEEIARVPGAPRDPRRLGELLAAVTAGLAAAPPSLPAGPRLDPAEVRARGAREDALRAWRKRAAAARHVLPMAVLPGYLLDDLVRSPPSSPEDLESRAGMIPKRVRLYAKQILAALGPSPAARPGDHQV